MLFGTTWWRYNRVKGDLIRSRCGYKAVECDCKNCGSGAEQSSRVKENERAEKNCDYHHWHPGPKEDLTEVSVIGRPKTFRGHHRAL